MIKRILKQLLAYRALRETAPIRSFLDSVRSPDYPYCPNWEGDLIWSLIQKNDYRRCLETEFGTGSTALYMLCAVSEGGNVVSIDKPIGDFSDIGKRNLKRALFSGAHELIEESSQKTLPALYCNNREFDFIYLDGWKTFDHVAMEVYFAACVLRSGKEPSPVQTHLDESRSRAENWTEVDKPRRIRRPGPRRAAPIVRGQLQNSKYGRAEDLTGPHRVVRE